MAISRKKILWIDDEIEFLRSHIMFLETRGYSVLPAFSGDDGIGMIEKNPLDFDLVLLDEQMPGKDGLTTLAELKEIRPKLPVIMVTKSEEEKVMVDAFGNKIDAYLTKPINPGKILSAIKQILNVADQPDNQLMERFARNFSENRSVIANASDTRSWTRLHMNLSTWDCHLDSIDNEGVRQTQAGQRSDANVGFINHFMANYPYWLRQPQKRPLLSQDVFSHHILPKVNDSRPLFVFVFDTMRLDQYLKIEHLIRKFYSVELEHFFTPLPSAKPWSDYAFFSGEIATDEALTQGVANDQLLRENFEKQSFDHKNGFSYYRIFDQDGLRGLLNNYQNHTNDRLIVIDVDFHAMLKQDDAGGLRSIAPDDKAYRTVAANWFRYSDFYSIFRGLSHGNAQVMLTALSGQILCSRGVELYGTKKQPQGVRYVRGKKINADERYVHMCDEPQLFSLPRKGEEDRWLFAKENFYFINPDNFTNYQHQYQNTFQAGGISLEEVVMPLATLTPL